MVLCWVRHQQRLTWTNTKGKQSNDTPDENKLHFAFNLLSDSDNNNEDPQKLMSERLHKMSRVMIASPILFAFRDRTRCAASNLRIFQSLIARVISDVRLMRWVLAGCLLVACRSRN